MTIFPDAMKYALNQIAIFRNTTHNNSLLSNKNKNFESNIKSYEGKKPYECDICGKVFDEEQNFKSHIESVHEGKKPYECDICRKVFDE